MSADSNFPAVAIGSVFGRLTVVQALPLDKKSNRFWLCSCRCGSDIRRVSDYVLRYGLTKSCGCLIGIKHGYACKGQKAQEYEIWCNMRRRCLQPSREAFKNYGGRGITICDRWSIFENFLADMGPRPSMQHTLERKENDKGYSPDNCCWATRLEQNNNSRSNYRITFNGRTLNMTQWAREIGIRSQTLQRRLTSLGWSVERALTEPVRAPGVAA